MEEKKERPSLPFGKEVRIGNWKVLKFTKTLTKEQLKAVRREFETRGDARGTIKGLRRAGIPYIKVEAISGVFALTFAPNTQIFRWLDYCVPLAVEAEERGEKLDGNGVADILHVFGMWMTDVCTSGDQQYYEDKARALTALIERQRPAGNAAGTVDDDKILEELKEQEEAKATILEMAKEIEEGGGDGGQ